MPYRSLFNIILKVIGLFFLPQILEAFFQLFFVIANLAKPDTFNEGFLNTILALLGFLIYVFIFYMFVFKSNFLVAKLKLDKDFEQENLSLNIHRETVLSISIIVIGGVMIVDSIPLLIRQIFSYFQYRQMQRSSFGNSKPFDTDYIIIYSIKLLIGLILVGNQKLLVNFIELKRRK